MIRKLLLTENQNRDSSGFVLRMTTTTRSVILSVAKNLIYIYLLLIAHCSLLIASSSFAAISTVDPQGGAYSSNKLQSDGKPAVAYFDHKTGELKYSYWTANGTVNQWIRTVVEEKGVTGYVSLSLDSGK